MRAPTHPSDTIAEDERQAARALAPADPLSTGQKIALWASRHDRVVEVGEWTRAAREGRAQAHEMIAERARNDAENVRVLAETFSNRLADQRAYVRRYRVVGGRVVTRTIKHKKTGRKKRYTDHREQRSKLFSLARHHDRAARGQRERIGRVLQCQTQAYTRICAHCGDVPERDALELERCGGWKYCASCNGARCADIRARVNAARDNALNTYRNERTRRLRPWGERFLTLTVPHSGSSAADLAVIHAAWRLAWRNLRDWMIDRDVALSRRRKRKQEGTFDRNKHDSGLPLPFVRVLELTGSSGGHAHAHVWTLSPYLPHHVVRVMWGKALAMSPIVPYVPMIALDDALAECVPPGPVCASCLRGSEAIHPSCGARSSWLREKCRRELRELATWNNCELAYLPWPVVDIRRVDSEIGAELVKYMIKNIEQGEPIPAFELAQMVEATEGRRMLSVAVGVWLELPGERCCGFSRSRVRVERPGDLPRSRQCSAPLPARGPPLQFIQEA